jgi:flagellar hook-basal body complex protein FliE
MAILLLLLTSEQEPIASPTIPVSRVSSFGVPASDLDDTEAVGVIDANLNAVTAALTGTATPYNFGTVASSLNAVTTALTGTVANPTPVTGSVASTLSAVTAALAGNMAAPITGTQASSLNAVTAALAGETIGGSIAGMLGAAVSASLGGTTTGNDVVGHINNAQLSAVTAALTGTHTPPAVTGTAAGLLSAVRAAMEGQGGTSNLPGDSYPWEKIKKRRERLRAEEQALNRKIRQRLGLEPPDPEPEAALEPGPQAPEPFYVSPNLGLVPLLERVGQLRGELQGLEAEHDAAIAEMALRAILLADDASPSIGEIDLPMLEEEMARPNSEVMIMTPGMATPLSELSQGMSQGMAQLGQGQQQMGQGIVQALQQMMAQLAESQMKTDEAIQALAQGQQDLAKAIKAPRKKSFTVKRGRDGRVAGADMMEEVGE